MKFHLSLAQMSLACIGLLAAIAHAELTDSSRINPALNAQAETSILENSGPSWLSRPDFRATNSLLRSITRRAYPSQCACIETAIKLADCKLPKEISGEILLEIDEQGTVTNTQMVESSGIYIFDRHILLRAKEGKFNPAYRNSEPVKSHAYLPLKLELSPMDPRSCSADTP